MERPSAYMMMTDSVTRIDYTRDLNKYIDYLESKINLSLGNVIKLDCPVCWQKLDKEGQCQNEECLKNYGVSDL